MSKPPTSNDDIVDSRDVIERLEELRSEKEDAVEQGLAELTDWDEENGEELRSLEALAKEGEGSREWTHGLALIRESYWVEYVEDMLKDIGDLPQDIPHYIAIDWEQTAENIRADYSALEWEGITFYYRD